MDPNELKLTKLKDAALLLGIPQKTLRKEVQAGRIRCLRTSPGPNGRIYFRAAELNRWLNEVCALRQYVSRRKRRAQR